MKSPFRNRFGRSLRRQLEAKQKEKARRRLRSSRPRSSIDDRDIGKHARTPTACSCWMCGNPRKYAKGKERVSLRERHLEPE